MRTEILSWEDLTLNEQTATAAIFPSQLEAISLFNSLSQVARDSLINIYYLMSSEKVAGNLWQYVKSLRWAGQNQIGIYAFTLDNIRKQIEMSNNFIADGWITCNFKNCLWSLRQVEVDKKAISEYGLQVYRPNDPAQPDLLVIDIDTIVFSSWLAWPEHAIDILRPDPSLNDPLRARRTLIARGIFPQ